LCCPTICTVQERHPYTQRLANEVSKVCYLGTDENNEPSSSDEEHDMPKLLDDEEVKGDNNKRMTLRNESVM